MIFREVEGRSIAYCFTLLTHSTCYDASLVSFWSLRNRSIVGSYRSLLEYRLKQSIHSQRSSPCKATVNRCPFLQGGPPLSNGPLTLLFQEYASAVAAAAWDWKITLPLIRRGRTCKENGKRLSHNGTPDAIKNPTPVGPSFLEKKTLLLRIFRAKHIELK